MKAKIYEYAENGITSFKENAVYGGLGSGWELEVEIPDFLNPYTTVCGDTVIQPENSFPQTISECLRANGGKPCLCVTWGKNNPSNSKYYMLNVISRKEADLALYL